MCEENLSFKGKTEIGKMLYDLDGKVLNINPMSLQDEKGNVIEVDSEVLIEQLEPIVKNLFDSIVKNKMLKELKSYIPKDVQIQNNQINSSLFNLYVENHITAEQYAGLYEKLMEYVKINNHYDIRSIIEEAISAIGYESRNIQGRFSKRLAAYLFQNYELRSDTNFLTEVGNIYNNAKLANKEFKLRITNNFSWEDGNYGKEDSCWWDGYTNSRDTLHHYGGYAMLFYPTDCPDRSTFCDERGYGRTWLYPINEELLITFNSYGNDGKETAAVAAKLMEELTGKHFWYGKREVRNNSGDSNYPYINGNNGHNNDGGSKCFAIYCGEKPDRTIYIDMKRQSEYFDDNSIECENCGRSIDDDGGYAVNDYTYCERCYEEMFFSCADCGEAYPRDEANIFEDRYGHYCSDCFNSEIAFTCPECGNSYFYLNGSTVAEDTHNTYCSRCAHHLEHCDEHNVNYENTCPTCQEELEEA